MVLLGLVYQLVFSHVSSTQLVIIDIALACYPCLGNRFDTGYKADHCAHTQAFRLLTVPWLYISVFWLWKACRINPMCGCCRHCFSHPHSCGQLLGHGGPVSLTIGLTPTFSITPKCCIKALLPYIHIYVSIGFTCQSNLPSLYSVSSSDCTLLCCFYSQSMSPNFPVITCDIVIERRAFDGLNQQLKLWLYTTPGHEETVRKFTFCSKKLSFDFSISKSGIIQICRAEIMPPLPFPTLFIHAALITENGVYA